MKRQFNPFAVNTYSYTMSHQAGDCLVHLAGQGYADFELMLYPGHFWPPDLGPGERKALRQFAKNEGLRITTLNMPNIDINIGAAVAEMREYSLALLVAGLELAGDVGIPCLLIGPGKPNPLFPMPHERLLSHLFAALDRLVPLAERLGTSIALENLPISFLPDAAGMMTSLDRYGDPRIGIVYDLANAVFHREDPALGLRQVSQRLRLIHVSDTGHDIYRHDPVGCGVVPFAALPPVIEEIGYRGPIMLEIISSNPDVDILQSADKLRSMGWGARRSDKRNEKEYDAN